MKLKALLATVLLSSGAFAEAPPAGTPVTNPEGEAYLDGVQKAVTGFTHREVISAFTAASQVPVAPAGAKQASVCVQKVANGMYRSHSNNPDARGIVTNQGDLAAFGPLFQLQPKQKFLLNVTANVDGTGDIVTYIGVIFAKDGDGAASGDTVCFARYLQTAVAAPAAITPAPAPAPAPTPPAA